MSFPQLQGQNDFILFLQFRVQEQRLWSIKEPYGYLYLDTDGIFANSHTWLQPKLPEGENK